MASSAALLPTSSHHLGDQDGKKALDPRSRSCKGMSGRRYWSSSDPTSPQPAEFAVEQFFVLPQAVRMRVALARTDTYGDSFRCQAAILNLGPVVVTDRASYHSAVAAAVLAVVAACSGLDHLRDHQVAAVACSAQRVLHFVAAVVVAAAYSHRAHQKVLHLAVAASSALSY